MAKCGPYGPRQSDEETKLMLADAWLAQMYLHPESSDDQCIALACRGFSDQQRTNIRQLLLREAMCAADREMQAILDRARTVDARPSQAAVIVRHLQSALSVPQDSSHPLLALLEQLEARTFEQVIALCKEASAALGIEDGRVRRVVSDFLQNGTAAFPRYRGDE